jgi:hypothetical protein
VQSASGAVDKAISLAEKERKMNPTELRKAIVEGIRSKLGKGVNIEDKQQEQYRSIKANGRLLVLLRECKAYVSVKELTISDKDNQTCKRIAMVYNEMDIPRAVEKIVKIYWEKKLS